MNPTFWGQRYRKCRLIFRRQNGRTLNFCLRWWILSCGRSQSSLFRSELHWGKGIMQLGSIIISLKLLTTCNNIIESAPSWFRSGSPPTYCVSSTSASPSSHFSLIIIKWENPQYWSQAHHKSESSSSCSSVSLCSIESTSATPSKDTHTARSALSLSCFYSHKMDLPGSLSCPSSSYRTSSPLCRSGRFSMLPCFPSTGWLIAFWKSSSYIHWFILSACWLQWRRGGKFCWFWIRWCEVQRTWFCTRGVGFIFLFIEVPWLPAQTTGPFCICILACMFSFPKFPSSSPRSPSPALLSHCRCFLSFRKFLLTA